MDTLEAIKTRRSVRQFKPTPLSESELQELIEYGKCAPSAGNEQPWVFKYTTDKSVIDKTNKLWNGKNEPLTNAHSAILVSCDVDKLLQRYGGIYWQQDCSAAVQNILLAAHAIGYGACWVGLPEPLSHQETIYEAWEFEYKYGTLIIPFALVAVGYLE